MRYASRRFVVEALRSGEEGSAAPETWDRIREFKDIKARHQAHEFAKARTESEKLRHRVVRVETVAIFNPKRET